MAVNTKVMAKIVTTIKVKRTPISIRTISKTTIVNKIIIKNMMEIINLIMLSLRAPSKPRKLSRDLILEIEI